MRSVGQYKDRVTIQRKVTAPSALGPTETWSTVETRWARVVIMGVQTQAALSKTEYQEVGYSQSSHIIYFRGDVDLVYATDRFIHKGVVLEMTGKLKDPEGLGFNTIALARTVPQDVDA